MHGAPMLRRSRMPSAARQDGLDDTNISRTADNDAALAQAMHACLVEIPGTLHRLGEAGR